MNKKHCRICGKRLTKSNWFKSCQKKCDYICKTCSRTKANQYYHKNIEQERTRKRSCYQKHKHRWVKTRQKWESKHKEQRREYNIKSKAKHFYKYENNRLEKAYKISLAEYNRLFNKQKGCCAICEKHQSELKNRLAVDHNHKTGKIRKLLCAKCNIWMGLLENKNFIEFTKKAKRYLEKHKKGI